MENAKSKASIICRSDEIDSNANETAEDHASTLEELAVRTCSLGEEDAIVDTDSKGGEDVEAMRDLPQKVPGEESQVGPTLLKYSCLSSESEYQQIVTSLECGLTPETEHKSHRVCDLKYWMDASTFAQIAADGLGQIGGDFCNEHGAPVKTSSSTLDSCCWSYARTLHSPSSDRPCKVLDNNTPYHHIFRECKVNKGTQTFIGILTLMIS